MNPTFLMIIGGLSFLIGCVFLFQVYFDKLIKNYHILFHRDINYRLYEDPEARESIKEARRMFGTIGFLLVIAGIAVFTWGCVVKYANRGNASIFSNNISEGIYKLDNEEGYFVQENSKTYDMIIVITGNEIEVNGSTYNSNEEFAEYIKGIDQVTKVYIKDDYAIASSFHYVESILNNNEKTRNFEVSEGERE